MAHYPSEIKKFLNEYEPAPYAIDPQELSKIKEKIAFAEKRLAHWQDQVTKLRAGIKTMCAHPTKIVNQSYFEGSYFDRATTIYTVKCQNCGKILFEHTETHDWFG